MMFFTFAIFGEKMISIVVFGIFLLVLITCYPNIIKSELLIEMKANYGGRTSMTKKRCGTHRMKALTLTMWVC